jgi:hypothetical protein
MAILRTGWKSLNPGAMTGGPDGKIPVNGVDLEGYGGSPPPTLPIAQLLLAAPPSGTRWVITGYMIASDVAGFGFFSNGPVPTMLYWGPVTYGPRRTATVTQSRGIFRGGFEEPLYWLRFSYGDMIRSLNFYAENAISDGPPV